MKYETKETSLEVPGENTSNEWLEPIADKEYEAL